MQAVDRKQGMPYINIIAWYQITRAERPVLFAWYCWLSGKNSIGNVYVG